MDNATTLYLKSTLTEAQAKRGRLEKQIAGLQASLAKLVTEINKLEQAFGTVHSIATTARPAMPIAPSLPQSVAMPTPPVWTQGQ